MNRIINHIANWLMAFNDKKMKVREDFNSYMKRGNNLIIFGLVLFGIYFLYMAFDLYRDYGKIWLASFPIILFGIAVFVALIKNAYRDKLKNRQRNSSIRLVGFNMDFNQPILAQIYSSLIRYEFLDENLNRFEDFYNVMIFDFDEHESVLHFNCTQAELKFILEKFKVFKRGLHLSTFERSGKIYNKGELISAKKLSKSYNKNPVTRETEDLIDSFFGFLGDN
ncbi:MULTISPECIES: DUF6617 family protein [Maribacter]|uniref:Uncharacterized protein n=2 Tax=Maribacter TaxID=252356 RepID=A0A5R8M9M1_9FLAO|nr:MULTISPECIES: DUF6617 family protein [Maribacter]KAA2219037.1 hypothetical protein F0361_05340 [Maribacter flavus]TLF46263.1 hypothetical protein FEK29_00350 [Maribacter aurantiacus]